MSWILHICLGRQMAASVIGDLEEQRRRRASRSHLGAELWFWANGVGVVAYVVTRRTVAAIATLGRRGSMDMLTSDLRQTMRAMAHRPWAAMALVLVLSLGVGLTSVMFALADPFLLQPLPYRNPSQLVRVTLSSGAAGLVTKSTALPTYQDWRQRRDLFDDLAAFSHFERQLLSSDAATEELTTQRVSSNFFEVLGQEVARTSGWAESTRSRQSVLALTERGRRKTGATTNQTLKDSVGSPRRVAAVLSPEFLFPSASRTLLLDGLVAYEPGSVIEVRRWNSSGAPGSSESIIMVGRLASGVSAEQVAAALSWTDEAGRVLEVDATPLREVMTSRVRPLALGALAACALVLLVCIGNVANLFIARNAYRTREMATRAALGASRLALGRLAMVESTVVAGAGTLVGVAGAWLALGAIRTVIPAEYTALGTPDLGGRVLVFSVAVGLTVTVLAAVPAWLARRVKRGSVFGRENLGDASRTRPIRFLVTAVQSGLAVVLAVGAALLLQSYSNLARQDTGFDRSVLAVTVRFATGLAGPAVQTQVDASLAELRRLPGVSHATASNGSMIDSNRAGMGLTVNGKAAYTSRKSVTPEFFDASGLSIIAGRPLRLEDRDRSGVVVNQAFVRQHWPDGNAVGQTVGFGIRQVPVVGVAADAFDIALDSAPQPTVFVLLHNPPGAAPLTFMIRTDGDADALREPVRRALSSVSRGIAIGEYSTVGQRLSQTVRDRSFATLMLTSFAIAALGVSAAGIVSVVMFIVAGRTREIAIRMAIGAGSGHVLWLVIRETFWAATAGAVTGAIAGRWLSEMVESLVYGVEAGSWPTTVVAVGVTVLLMALAALLPARQALRLEPTAALRIE